MGQEIEKKDGVEIKLSSKNQALYNTLSIIFSRAGFSVEARLPIIINNTDALQKFLKTHKDKGVTQEGLENLMNALGNPTGLPEKPDISGAVDHLIVGGERKGFINEGFKE